MFLSSAPSTELSTLIEKLQKNADKVEKNIYDVEQNLNKVTDNCVLEHSKSHLNKNNSFIKYLNWHLYYLY